MLALLFGVMLFPTIPDSAHAETPATPAEASPRATTSVSLNVPATIEFADVMATPSGATTTASATIGVTTTASAGYKLYLYAEDNSLKSLNPSTTQSIASASASSLNNFTNNTWGYNLTEGPTAGTTYSALPTTNTTPTQTKDTSTTNSANDTYTLSLGAKVDSTIPSGTYTSTLTISVVAEPKEVTTITEMATMQEMTSEICVNSQEGDTIRVKDERDGKMYWVAKLKDGNCWMTQNLDFDIPADGLNNENGLAAKTDLPDGTVWDSSSSYPPQSTTIGSPFSSTSATGTYSFDPGLYVNDPSKGWSTCNTYYEDPSTCTASNWTDVSSMSPMTTERADGTVVDGNTYDAHYLVGNYYLFNAATAGTGASVTTDGNNASSSICPKGWRLPSRGNSNDTNDFYALTTGNSVTTGSTLSKAPYYFIPAGFALSGSLVNAGIEGGYWSSTANSSRNAYFLYSISSSVGPSVVRNRYAGQSVRCLAR